MKKLILLSMLMLTGEMAFAQGNNKCDKYVESKFDEVTGKSSTSSKKELIISHKKKDTGFNIFIMQSDSSVAISIQAIGTYKCIDEGAKAYVLFTDGKRLTLLNSSFNCKYEFNEYLHLSDIDDWALYTILKSKKIKTLRVMTHGGFVEETFTDTEAETFRSTLSCLFK